MLGMSARSTVMSEECYCTYYGKVFQSKRKHHKQKQSKENNSVL
jgi:hypothetical protein